MTSSRQYAASAAGLVFKTPETIATGAFPIGVAVSSDGNAVYVTNEADGTLTQYSGGDGPGTLIR